MTHAKLGVTLLGVLATTVLQVGELGAQSAQAPPRAIQPHYTRIIESDTMVMWGPDLSLDGRWVVFSGLGEGANSNNLWIVSAAGGTPARLTSGPFNDFWARWSPAGDRIAFLSNRPSPEAVNDRYLMAIPMERETGRATGLPRQVTLSPANGLVTFSPDGQWLAYLAGPGDRASGTDQQRLMVIPATGGTARELAVHSGSTGWPFIQWSADGRYLYYTSIRPGRSGMHTIARVAVAGGSPEELTTVRARVIHVDPAGRYALRIGADPGTPSGGGPGYEILTTDGRAIARFGTRFGMWLWRFTPDARGVIAQQWHGVGPLRAVPVAGGAIRQVTDGRGYFWPSGWSPDASRVFAIARGAGEPVILEAPLDGRAAREWQVPTGAGSIWLSRDARYLWYTLATNDPEVDRLLVQQLDGSGRREVSSEHFNLFTANTGAVGPGGQQGDELLFFKRREGRLELWAAPPDGAPRLLRAFPMTLLSRTYFGVHGNRIAYTERHGDSTTLFLAEGKNGQPRRLISVPGSLSEPVWSHDGRWIAGHYYALGDSVRYSVFAIGVRADATPSGPPRIIPTEKGWGWQIQWLPDDRAVTVLCGSGGGQTGVWLVSLRDGNQPMELTRDESAAIWYYRLSPDGKYVVYPAEVSRGSSLWRLDFGDLLR